LPKFWCGASAKGQWFESTITQLKSK